MLLKYFENKLSCVTTLEGIQSSFKLLDDFKGYTEEDKCFEMNGKIIKKAYELGYKKECYDFVKAIAIGEIKDFELRSFLSHILVRTSILTGNIKHKLANDIANGFDPSLYHIEYRDRLAINSALLLRKNGFTSKSIDLLESHEPLKENVDALFHLGLNYSFIEDFDKETKIYEKLEKFKEPWIHDVLFFRKAKIFIKTKKKNKLKKILAGKDLYQLLKTKKYRNVRCLELYQIFSFLGDVCKAKFYLKEATRSNYDKLETEVASRKRALEILEREFK